MNLRQQVKHLLPLRLQNIWRSRSELLDGEPELHLLSALCARDGVMVDVGANVGIYTHLARQYAGHIMAIEPQPALAAALRGAYGGRQVDVVSCGLSDQPGTFRLYVPVVGDRRVDTRASLLPGLNDTTEEALDVEIRTLDSFELQKVSLIKIDVEGFELEVLRGARATLTRCRPAVIVEAEERMRPGTVNEVADFMGKLDYTGYFIFDRGLQPFTSFDAARHQAPGSHVAIGAARSDSHVNNFIYLPADQPALHQRSAAALSAWFEKPPSVADRTIQFIARFSGAPKRQAASTGGTVSGQRL